MDFNTVYAQKLTTADRVAALVKDDDWVDYGWAIGTPVSFDAALAKRLPELHGIKFRGGILCHVPEIFKIENQAEHFCWNSWHMGGIERRPLPPVTLTILPCATPSCRATTAKAPTR